MSSGLAFEVFTLFPDAVQAFLRGGLIGKAVDQGLVAVHCTDYREFARDRHRTVDDTPYGGGAGMVMKIGPVVDAVEAVAAARGPMHRVLVTPSAPRFDQRAAERLAKLPRIALLCGRYEGIDDRVREGYVDECLSIGDFVLNGGESAALVIIEAVARLREGVLGNPESIAGESFSVAPTDSGGIRRGPWLEHPHYTRPVSFRGAEVPKVLLSGDHQAIARWRAEEACRRTWAVRPDLRPTPAVGGRPVYLGAVLSTHRRGEDAPRGDHLSRLCEIADLPVALVGRPESAELEAIVPAVCVRDLKALRRQLRRTHGRQPQLVALVGEDEAIPGAIDDPRLLLELLAIRQDDAANEDAPPLVLLIGCGRDLLEKADALYAPLPPGPPQESLELAPSARMIESSQPQTATRVEARVVEALRRLRPLPA
ncbi:MAG: tRNA (guanosine(37)-N1)-methyltransferase TrmD [Nannocystaceae bacterium]